MRLNRRNFLRLAGLAPVAALVPQALDDLDISSKNLLKPAPLKKGDTLGLIAPGSPVYASSDFDKMLGDLKSMGFKLKLGKHVRNRMGYLAGNDEDRAGDLMEMFEDPEVDGIICVRGGYGCTRILPLLDFGRIKANYKVFMGFSDITALHLAFHKYCGFVTFHGPVGKAEWTHFTRSSFQNVVFDGKEEIYSMPLGSSDAYTIHPGSAEGILLGGNLTVLTSMLGSNFLPSFKGAILFLEDVGENVYKVDRMLMQLKLAGILDQINGFIFGKCTDCMAGANSLSLNQVLEHYIKPLGIPAYYGAMISHEDDNITIPVGVRAAINATDKSFMLLESGVK